MDMMNKDKFIVRKCVAEDVADEMLAILSERNQIMAKKKMEATNAEWNEMMWNGFPYAVGDN